MIDHDDAPGGYIAQPAPASGSLCEGCAFRPLADCDETDSGIVRNCCPRERADNEHVIFIKRAERNQCDGGELTEYPYADYIPVSDAAAEAWLQVLPFIAGDLITLPKNAFMALWCAVVHMHPTEHPDDCDGWPRPIQDVAIEAFRRRNTDEISDEELYPAGVIACNLGRRVRKRRLAKQKGIV